MDRKQIEQWAHDSAMAVNDNDDYEDGIGFACDIAALERFAARVEAHAAAHEREQCAQLCHSIWYAGSTSSDAAHHCEDAIRARGATNDKKPPAP